jgi:dienelactone hydrolase
MQRMTKQLSVDLHFRNLAIKHRPKFRFEGNTPQQWRGWRDALLPELIATLGRMPAKVPLNAQIQAEWREDGLIKQRVHFQVEDGLSVAAYVFRPENAKGKLPAILACHGHGQFGKEPVMGDRSHPEIARDIDGLKYDYGLQLAKAGFVTMAIDWRGFGERDDRRKPIHHDLAQGRDLCDVHFVQAVLLGMTLLGMNLHDGQRAVDYLTTQDFVDPGRIGIIGLSFGGTMATWMSIVDDRIKAADVVCYSTLFSDFAFSEANCCGSQITPGLFALCDLPDLHGLIAPRPLLVEMGIHDTCFYVDSAQRCYREVEKIYKAAGASEKLYLDLFAGGHRWGGNQSVKFFRDHL